jgi:putative oxidoreductase
MTTFTATQTVTPVRRPRRARAARVGLWTIRIVLAAQFAAGGVLKLSADPQMVAMFERLGDGQGLRLMVGLCEVAGAVGLLIPRLARLAGIGLVALMVGAAVANVVVLEASPVLPLALLVLAAVVVVATRSRSAR